MGNIWRIWDNPKLLLELFLIIIRNNKKSLESSQGQCPEGSVRVKQVKEVPPSDLLRSKHMVHS